MNTKQDHEKTIIAVKKALSAICKFYGGNPDYADATSEALDKIYKIKPNIDRRKMFNWIYKETKETSTTSLDCYNTIYQRIIRSKPMPWTDIDSTCKKSDK